MNPINDIVSSRIATFHQALRQLFFRNRFVGPIQPYPNSRKIVLSNPLPLFLRDVVCDNDLDEEFVLLARIILLPKDYIRNPPFHPNFKFCSIESEWLPFNQSLLQTETTWLYDSS